MLIKFTSGTESNPRAVLHTYQTFLSTHLQSEYELKIIEQDNISCLTLLYHMFIIGLYYGASHFKCKDYDVPSVINNFV